MAVSSRIYKTTDWNIWTYVPEPDTFILNLSQLDGTDPLGSSGGSLQPSNVFINSIEINEGQEIQSGILSEPAAASLTASLTIKNYTVQDAIRYVVGSPIWVTLKNQEIVPEKRYGFNTPIFIGKITAVDAQVSPDSDFASITLSAQSNTADMLNMLLKVTKGIVEDKFYYIDEAAYAQYPPEYYEDNPLFPTLFVDLRFCEAGRAYNFANSVTENKTIGDWLKDYYAAELWPATDSTRPYRPVFNDGVSTFIDYSTGPILAYPYPWDLVVTTEYFDADINACTLGWSGSNSPTGVDFTLYSNNSIVYKYSTSQNNLASSAFNYSSVLDVKNIDEMQAVGQRAIAIEPIYTATSITVEVAKNNQEIEFKDGSFPFDDTFLQPTKLAHSGDQIKVTLDKFGISEEILIITGRNISVTPDTFLVTYNLWKGFKL